MLKKHRNSQRGASLVEYAILIALLLLFVLASIRAIGTRVNDTFSSFASTM